MDNLESLSNDQELSDILDSNSSRLGAETDYLIRNRELKVELTGKTIHYKLTRRLWIFRKQRLLSIVHYDWSTETVNNQGVVDGDMSYVLRALMVYLANDERDAKFIRQLFWVG